jgi:UDP-glucose 4-epimerase
MRVLVTGGAGYIGAHVVRVLRERGDEVLIVDDLVTGIPERNAGVKLVEMSLAQSSSVDALANLLAKHSVDSVIHFAARKQVGESVAKPAWYYSENVGGLAHVLLAMERADVGCMIFSSSAAVYGDARGYVSESAPKVTTSPYGETKLIGEWLLNAAVSAQRLDAISLRYFNVAGAGWPDLGDKMALNMSPLVIVTQYLSWYIRKLLNSSTFHGLGGSANGIYGLRPAGGGETTWLTTTSVTEWKANATTIEESAWFHLTPAK